MSNYKKLAIMFIVGMPLIFFLLFIMLFTSQETASGSDEVVVATTLNIPFNSSTHYHISSNFGFRNDPFIHETKFHSGIDLSTSCGTPVLASGNGIVEEANYSNGSLGNYIYIKHEFNGEILYTAYGHLLDNSILVHKDQIVSQGDRIASVGSTGRSTGCHLHFTIMKGKISFNYSDLIDPKFVVSGLK